MGWNAEQRFNTQGQTKCGYCGLYYPEGWASHNCRAEKIANGEEDD